MTDSEDDPQVLETDEPLVKVSSNIPDLSNALHNIMSDLVRDLGVSSAGSDASQGPGTQYFNSSFLLHRHSRS